MKIILIRHGETTWNQESRIQGCTDIPLAPSGCEQLHITGEHLAQTGISIDHILSSPLQRARTSAEIIAGKMNYPVENILAAPLFTERRFGEMEGMVYSDAIAKYPDNNCPGMETLDMLIKRAAAAINYCTTSYPGKTLLITSHGALIKAILVSLTRGNIGYFDEDIWIENGSYCMLDEGINGWNISVHSPRNRFQPQVIQKIP